VDCSSGAIGIAVRAALFVVMLNSVSCASVHLMKLNPVVFNGNVDNED
jgi:hypothetical protein